MQPSNEHKRKVSRREFIRLSSVATAGVVVTACGGGAAPAAEDAPAPAPAESNNAPASSQDNSAMSDSMYKEAPELADMVSAGELPPIDERLPPDPVVIQPLDSIGEYGGLIRTVMVKNRAFQVRSSYGLDGLFRVARDHTTVMPNIAESWEFADDGKSFTVHLHKGLRWSDGEPWNANSIAYWWNYDMLNEELSPSQPSQFKPGGELAGFEQIDDSTVRWTFSVPHPTITLILAHVWGVNMMPRTCQHYLQQFHPDFVDKADLDKLVADEGFEFWYELYGSRRGDASYGMPREHIEMPTLTAHKLSKPLKDNLWVLERNPYYWKVDPDGQQLPYVNGVIITNAESPEVANALIASGEINFSNGFVATLDNFALYQENTESGHYEVRLFNAAEGSAVILQPNHTAEDPVLRELFNDLRFKRALSYAIDRDTMNQVIFQGVGYPANTNVIPASKFYEQSVSDAHIQYDLDLANSLLDEIGLDQRDSSGYRLRSDGNRLSINFEYTDIKSHFTPVAELLIDFWKEVGIELNIKLVAGEILQPRIEANEIDFGMWHGDKSSDVLFPTTPQWWVPYDIGWERPWGSQWGAYYRSGGEEGVEPPAEIQEVYDTWQAMLQTVDEDEFIRLGKKILQSQADNLWTIGTVGGVPEPIIVGSNLKNYPQEGYTGFDWLGTYPYHAEQLYFEGGEWAGEPG